MPKRGKSCQKLPKASQNVAKTGRKSGFWRSDFIKIWHFEVPVKGNRDLGQLGSDLRHAPWNVYGEGPAKFHGWQFGEKEGLAFSGQDIRFTSRPGQGGGGGATYPICLAWPGEELKITSMGSKPALGPVSVSAVKLLGVDENLKWSPAMRCRSKPPIKTRGLRLRVQGHFHE